MKKNWIVVFIPAIFLSLQSLIIENSKILDAQTIPVVTPTSTGTSAGTTTPICLCSPTPTLPTLPPTDTGTPTVTPPTLIPTDTSTPTLPPTNTGTPTGTRTPTVTPPTLIPTDTPNDPILTNTLTPTLVVPKTPTSSTQADTPVPTSNVPGRPTPVPPTLISTDIVANSVEGTLQEALLIKADEEQVIRFNPDSALQKRVFLDLFVPNSPEIKIRNGSIMFTVQRAENLVNGIVRVYYVTASDWDNVHYIEPSVMEISSIEQLLVNEVEKRQAIQFNPSAALQKHIFADEFVPNSPEFTLQYKNTLYVAQRAENLQTGLVRVYFIMQGDWSNVRFVERTESSEVVL